MREHRQLAIPVVDAAPDFVRPKSRRTLGADVFVESALPVAQLGESLMAIAGPTPLRLKMISNRGTKVFPSTGAMPDCIDHYRCRFVLREENRDLDDATLLELLKRVAATHRWMHVEKLQEFDGKAAYTRAQGED